jgi:hypothetical protein
MLGKVPNFALNYHLFNLFDREGAKQDPNTLFVCFLFGEVGIEYFHLFKVEMLIFLK